MKVWKSLLAAASLAALALPAAAQELLSVRLVGTVNLALGASSTSSSPSHTFSVADVGGEIPKAAHGSGGSEGSGSGTASIPTPLPTSVARTSSAFGFPGLSEFSQASAGTGTFAGTQFQLEPPDQGLCAGEGFVMEPINNAIAIYDTHGHLIAGPAALSQFFNLNPEETAAGVFGQFISDPRCYFDTQTRRWFVTELEIDTDPTTGNFLGKSSELIAVSQTSNPFGAYYLYAIDTTDAANPGCPCLGDQPLIGANAYGFFLTSNEFPLFAAGFNGAQMYALSKSQLESGTVKQVVHINVGLTVPVPAPDQPAGGLWYSVQPASSSNPGSSSIEYFLSALQFGPAPFDDRVAVWALTNTESLNSKHPNPQLLHTVIQTESYGALSNYPFAAAQASGSTPLRDFLNGKFKDHDTLNLLSANDDRMNQVQLANGVLWSGVNTHVSVHGQIHQGIAWWGVAPFVNGDHVFAQVVDQGYVAVAGEDVLFPSIAVNGNGQPVMSFTLAGPDYYPSTAYAMVGWHGGPVHILGRGVGPDDGFTGYNYFVAPAAGGIARWGDYSAAVTDEWGNVWVAAEYIGQHCSDQQWLADTTCNGTRTELGNFGTFIGLVPSGDEN